LGTSYFYLVYDVFDGTHRTTGMKLNVERKVGAWTSKTTVPVAVHNQDLLDAIAIRFAGLCNELQVVAKSSSYTDALVLLYKELLNLAKSKATEMPTSSSTAVVVQAPGGKAPSKAKRQAEAAAAAALKEKRKGLEEGVLEYFSVRVRQSKNILSHDEQREFLAMFDGKYVKARLSLAEFLRERGLNALSSLERVPIRKVLDSWEKMCPVSRFTLAELKSSEKATLFPNASKAMIKINHAITTIITGAHEMLGIEKPKRAPVEVNDLKGKIVMIIGRRLLCWHLAYFSERIWQFRKGAGSAKTFNQYNTSKVLCEVYLQQCADQSVTCYLNDTMTCFWNDIAFLFKLQNQLKKAQDVAAGSNDAGIQKLNNYIVFDEPPLVLADEDADQAHESFELMLYTLLKVLLFIVKWRRSLDLIPTGPHVCCRGVECCKSAVPQAQCGKTLIFLSVTCRVSQPWSGDAAGHRPCRVSQPWSGDAAAYRHFFKFFFSLG